jgi:hypothetical protein
VVIKKSSEAGSSSSSSSIELVVKNWAQFWSWQSKVIEKKNGKKRIRLCKEDFICNFNLQ